MHLKTTVPEPAPGATGSSALGALLVASSLLVVLGLFAFAEHLPVRNRARVEHAPQTDFKSERECTRTTPRLPPEFVA